MKIIGIDIGTTSVCGICYNIQNGNMIKTINRPNYANISGKFDWEKLQDASILFKVVEEILQELLVEEDVCGIGVTGQMHGIVYLNENGEAVSPLYTWQDGRGEQNYKDGKSYASWLAETTGYPVATGYGSVTHFYNVMNGLVPKDAKTFCTIQDYVAMRLAKNNKPMVHPSNAASFGLYDLTKKKFDLEAFTKAGMDSALLPEVKDGYEILGKNEAGIPIAIAIGDNQASVLGAVEEFETTILVNVGTGSQVSCIVKEIPEHSLIDVRPFVDGYHLLVGSPLCGGSSYAMLERFFREIVNQITGIEIESAYAAMGACMEKYVPSHSPLEVETTFCGTRQEPDKRGSIRNIDMNNMTIQNLCDAFMRGMAKELYDLYLQMEPYMCVKPTKIVGAGNGIRRNPYLARQIESMFSMKLHVSDNKEEAALGVAKFALLSHTHEKSFENTIL